MELKNISKLNHSERGIRLIDIHSHILPYVDDGAEDMISAIEMAEVARDLDFKAIIATPHYIEDAYNKDKAHNMKVLERLKSALKEKSIDIDVYLGNELFITLNTLELLEKGEVTTLNKSRYILMELPRIDMPIYTESTINSLKLKGYIPIIAHPERYIRIIENPNILYDFIKMGALAQLNLPSLIGIYGKKAQETARILLSCNMVHFVGTDGHSPGKKYSNLDKSIENLKSLISMEEFNRITNINPQCIIDDVDISIQQPIRYVDKKGFKKLFDFIFKK